MSIALFSMSGLLFILRWLHFIFGIIWIGLLYYFNFVQGPFFAETDAATKSGAIQKLVPRALWWFRWGAMGTFLSGWLYIGAFGHINGPAVYSTSWGLLILTGATLGTLMWANVWFVIWPKQKIVIASATQVAKGGAAIPEAAAAGARAGVASRTNTLFSIALLFFMGGASHLPVAISDTTNWTAIILINAIIIIALQINAVKGKTGPMTTVKGVIHCGVGLTAVLYAVMEIFR